MSAAGEAERRIAELQAALDAHAPDPKAVELLSERVASALRGLSRAVPPADLARVADLHACVRATAERRRTETADALERARADRARLSRLTRPSGSGASLDLDA